MKTKLVIFGITGDLSRRKLLPALRDIVSAGNVTDLSIIGVSRREVDVPALIQESAGDSSLVDLTTVHTMDLAERGDYDGLRDSLDLKEDESLVIYLSVPPSAAADIVDFLGQAGLNTPNVKIMFEKPFGFDVDTAHEFIERTGQFFSEEQIYRIDHYMAKETAATIAVLRSQARTHHHEWSSASVARIDIVASEVLGVEDRATFYEQTGALRDLVQGHLMQLLSLVLLDASGGFELNELPERRLAALQQLAEADPARTLRAQYEGYDVEVENPGSRTETFVRIELESTDPRWTGVPITLTTGKKLSEKKTSVMVRYKDGTADEFAEGSVDAGQGRPKDAYERVLLDAIEGRKAIFTTSPEIIRSWEVLSDVQQAWAFETQPLASYPQGTPADQVL